MAVLLWRPLDSALRVDGQGSTGFGVGRMASGTQTMKLACGPERAGQCLHAVQGTNGRVLTVTHTQISACTTLYARLCKVLRRHVLTAQRMA
eukprot:344303-Chlamydomonas_euryale.AAC.6